MREVRKLGEGQRGWMKPGRVHVAPDGSVSAEAEAFVITDEERARDSEAALALRGRAEDPYRTSVARSRGGTLLVDPEHSGMFALVPEGDTPAGVETEPAEICPRGESRFPEDDSDLAPRKRLCAACGDRTLEALEGEYVPGVYCGACFWEDERRARRGVRPRWFWFSGWPKPAR